MRAVLVFVLALLGALPAFGQDLTALARPVAEDTRLDQARGEVSLTLGLTQGVPYRVYTLADPNQLVLELSEVSWTGFDPSDLTTRDAGPVRVGDLAPGWSGLVVDLDGPFELIESARVEGVAEWKIFWYIVLPLMRPAIAALAVLIFTFVWNDFFWANVLTQGETAKPITAGVRALNGQFVNNWHLVSAASLLAAMPPGARVLLMQTHIIAGLTLGAVK